VMNNTCMEYKKKTKKKKRKKTQPVHGERNPNFAIIVKKVM